MVAGSKLVRDRFCRISGRQGQTSNASGIGNQQANMKITVILCTYNRCRLLQTALESVAGSVVADGNSWEVLVVDNNSKDQTRQIVEEFSERYPGRFRYLFEARPGKSYALNAGISASTADVLAFMDDDVTVAADWLQNLTGPLGTEGFAGTGGRVLPLWGGEPPAWTTRDSWAICGPLVSFDRGEEGLVLEESPVGTNMAFKRRVFDQYGLFRVDLGPSPNNEIRNEDSEFARRLFANKEQLYYEPEAVVYHPIADERLTQKYFLKWWFDKGRSQIRESGVPSDSSWVVGGVPLYLVRRWTRWTLRWLLTPALKDRFECKLKAWFNAGLIKECYRQARNHALLEEVPADSRTAV